MNGMIPALGVSNADETGGTRPKNEEAYDLYLRSIALGHDGAQNTEAIRMLERSVGLDPTFAPALAALGIRYYYDEEYGTGSDSSKARLSFRPHIVPLLLHACSEHSLSIPISSVPNSKSFRRTPTAVTLCMRIDRRNRWSSAIRKAASHISPFPTSCATAAF